MVIKPSMLLRCSPKDAEVLAGEIACAKPMPCVHAYVDCIELEELSDSEMSEARASSVVPASGWDPSGKQRRQVSQNSADSKLL